MIGSQDALRGLALLGAGASLAVVAVCPGSWRRGVAPEASVGAMPRVGAPPGASSPSSRSSTVSAAPPAAPPTAAPSASQRPAATSPSRLPGAPRAPLAPFRKALDRARTEPVRILWLGDSHSAADYWSHVVRRRLQARHGNGGPGYFHLGVNGIRHGRAAVYAVGRWVTVPRNPATSGKVSDGVFGLGGIRVEPRGAGGRIRLQLHASAAPLKASFTLMLRRVGPRSKVAVTLGSRRQQLGPGAGPDDALRGEATAIESITMVGPGNAPFVVRDVSSGVELLGAIVESVPPRGVVIDTLGINGARLATALAWDEASWHHLVQARAPALAVLAYGTNEVFQRVDPQRYRDHYRAMMGRLRRAAPGIACLLVGPTDTVDRHWVTRPRVIAIDRVQREVAAELGCGYFSPYAEMAGEGGARAWHQAEPPLARGDRVHLTRRGYERLGERIARTLDPRLPPVPTKPLQSGTKR